MTVSQLKKLADDSNVEVLSSDNKSQIEAKLTQAGVSIEDEPLDEDIKKDEDSIYIDDDSVIVPRGTMKTIDINGKAITVVDGLDFPITLDNMMNCRWKKFSLYPSPQARKRHETAEGLENGGFDVFLYRKGSLAFSFLTDDRQFVKDFKENKIFSFNLTAEISGKTLRATEYNAQQRELRWHLNSIVSKIDQDYVEERLDKADMRKFKRSVFNAETFKADPSALVESGILAHIMKGSA